MPFLLILSSFFLNYKFNSSNEIIILKQYFSFRDNLILCTILSSVILVFYFVNNEIFSVNLYHKYKIQELEIRNNLKLGVPSSNEFHIESEVSIFFEKLSNDKFYNVEAIIYEDGQFIKSQEANIEVEKKSYNIIFDKGERVIFNDSEKSRTIFDKFIYSIDDKEIEMLMLDKEHFNTIGLLNEVDKEFNIHGHNRIYQYFLTFVIVIISFKIFFIYASKKNVFKYYTFLFISVLLIQVVNSYLIFLLNNNSYFNLNYYYLINFLILLLFSFITLRFNENN